MSFLGRLFGRGGEGPIEPPAMPWDRRPSLYDHIRAHVDADRPGLLAGGETLPDEERANEGSRLRWAAGALDGVMGHHLGQGDNEQLVREAVELVLGYCQSPTAATKAALYGHILKGNTLPLIDQIIEALVGTDRLNQERLYELAYSFVTEASDREPVKFGCALLGLFRNPEHEPLFQTLGRHEEFTLFCAVALSNLSDEPEPSLWKLAQNVNGWGRIHVVERLAHTTDPEIKDWLLREGYRNSVMYEYLVYTCATTGGLLAALSEETVDRELLTAAGEILAALIAGGPAENIDDYDEGALAAEMYLGHMESAAETLADFVHVQAIKEFLDDEDADWDSRAQRGWTSARRNSLRAACDRILNRPDWTERARQALDGDDEHQFHRGNLVAEALGLDTWPTHWRRLREKPTDSARWFHAMARCNADRLGDAIELAEQHIDLDSIATGPANEMGLGPGWEHHQCLDYLLQELREFPGQGQDFIAAGLRSPVVRNRNMAVAALAAWGRDCWPDAIKESLETAAKNEPEDDVRERMQQALRSEPIDE